MSDLVSLSDVKATLGITGTNDDAAITALLAGADDAVAAYCGRAIRQASVTEHYNGGGPTIVVRSWPIAASPALVLTDRVNDAVVSTDTYEVDLETGQIRMKPAYGIFTRGINRWKVVYTGGYAPGSVPGAIKVGIAKMIEAGLQTAGLKSESDMGYSYTREDMAAGAVPEIARAYLDKYRAH